MDFMIGILEFIVIKVYSPYLVVIFIGSGIITFCRDTEYAYLFNNNKDFVVSFFLGLFNISAGLLLILIEILYRRYIF